MYILSFFKKTVLEILFPRFCFNCKKEGSHLCLDCSVFLSDVTPTCPGCNKHSFFGKTHQKCKEKTSLIGIISFWEYEGVAKRMILFSKEKSILSVPGELLNLGILSFENDNRFSEFLSFLFDKETNIFFIPEKENGLCEIDHSELTALSLGKITKKSASSFLNINKQKQVLQKVILVSDVYKSGETMEEEATILKKIGVKEIWGFSLVKAP